MHKKGKEYLKDLVAKKAKEHKKEKPHRKSVIREGEKEWIPLMLVVGEKEVKAEKYPIRVRNESDFTVNMKELIEIMTKMQENEPQRSLPLPERISLRSKFRG